MTKARIILPFIMTVLFMSGCRSLRHNIHDGRADQSLDTFVNEPPVQELTSSLSLNYEGTRLRGQLKMRRHRSIQISANLLGLLEVARIEFLPDRIVAIDRYNNRYAECGYHEIPYSDKYGFEFDMIEALLWNKLFAPGQHDKKSIKKMMTLRYPDKRLITENQYGYSFHTDGEYRLYAVSKSESDYSFRVEYADFISPVKGWEYPQQMVFHLKSSETDMEASVRISSISVENKSWTDRTQIPRRMSKVTLEELLKNSGL